MALTFLSQSKDCILLACPVQCFLLPSHLKGDAFLWASHHFTQSCKVLGLGAQVCLKALLPALSKWERVNNYLN